ncbi:hypothetical protein EYF80_037453 [Liparis tanakae]|uniref:Uncharacterized protein n=1 Tax=Liparis tanakae TaxID=230148 RepID=A0A4Z2GGF8_9TELE|nr:hypothetical protein EYF80_037453 [Liparis tanakae]
MEVMALGSLKLGSDTWSGTIEGNLTGGAEGSWAFRKGRRERPTPTNQNNTCHLHTSSGAHAIAEEEGRRRPGPQTSNIRICNPLQPVLRVQGWWRWRVGGGLVEVEGWWRAGGGGGLVEVEGWWRWRAGGGLVEVEIWGRWRALWGNLRSRAYLVF